MILSYFDSSVLLTILLEEERQEEAFNYWQNSTRVSSILLKIETLMSLRRTYETNKKKLSNNWLSKKMKTMEEYLSSVYYMVLNDKIEREIFSRKELTQCRSLEAIHLATALRFREINNNDKETYLYTFDKKMHSLARDYNFKTNIL